MDLQILISTMKKNKIEELELKDKNINCDVVIINQTDNDEKQQSGNIKMINYSDIGLAKSRNRALENASGGICIISDDDVKYIKNVEDVVINAFKENEDVDIITFQIETPEGEKFKAYREEEYNHDKRSVLRVSSIEVAFRLDSIRKNNIKFDENFGLGSHYISGEENIFLMDCLKKGLKMKYIPTVIAFHEKESSGKILNERAIYSKGALFYRLFGIKSIYLNLGFVVKKAKLINFNIFKALYLIYKGNMDYITKCK